MKTGTDRLEDEIERLVPKNRKIAVLCNQASINKRFEHIIDILIKKGITPVYIFSPEHGLYGLFQDMIEVKERKRYRDIPVISLYGKDINSLYPPEDLIKNLDYVIVDLPDIGTRFYTFAATMLLFMKKTSGRHIRFLICDRPNPIGGTEIEGNGVRDGFRSFVGITDMPVRHSLTIGELALFFKAIENIDLRISIIKMTGYDRSCYLDDYLDSFVPPSPNIPSLNTAFVYPMGCLFEGTNISEGRGTTRPFEQFGADFIDPYKLTKELSSLNLTGVHFRPVFFIPKFHKFKDRICGGAFVHITDRKRFKPYITGIAILHTIRRLYGERLIWRRRAYEFVKNIPAIDLLFGTDKIRFMIDKGISLRYITDFVRQEEREYITKIKHHRIY